jgi:hypothetical protein
MSSNLKGFSSPVDDTANRFAVLMDADASQESKADVEFSGATTLYGYKNPQNECHSCTERYALIYVQRVVEPKHYAPTIFPEESVEIFTQVIMVPEKQIDNSIFNEEKKYSDLKQAVKPFDYKGKVDELLNLRTPQSLKQAATLIEMYQDGAHLDHEAVEIIRCKKRLERLKDSKLNSFLSADNIKYCRLKITGSRKHINAGASCWVPNDQKIIDAWQNCAKCGCHKVLTSTDVESSPFYPKNASKRLRPMLVLDDPDFGSQLVLANADGEDRIVKSAFIGSNSFSLPLLYDGVAQTIVSLASRVAAVYGLLGRGIISNPAEANLGEFIDGPTKRVMGKEWRSLIPGSVFVWIKSILSWPGVMTAKDLPKKLLTEIKRVMSTGVVAGQDIIRSIEVFMEVARLRSLGEFPKQAKDKIIAKFAPLDWDNMPYWLVDILETVPLPIAQLVSRLEEGTITQENYEQVRSSLLGMKAKALFAHWGVYYHTLAEKDSIGLIATTLAENGVKNVRTKDGMVSKSIIDAYTIAKAGLSTLVAAKRISPPFFKSLISGESASNYLLRINKLPISSESIITLKEKFWRGTNNPMLKNWVRTFLAKKADAPFDVRVKMLVDDAVSEKDFSQKLKVSSKKGKKPKRPAKSPKNPKPDGKDGKKGKKGDKADPPKDPKRAKDGKKSGAPSRLDKIEAALDALIGRLQPAGAQPWIGMGNYMPFQGYRAG